VYRDLMSYICDDFCEGGVRIPATRQRKLATTWPTHCPVSDPKLFQSRTKIQWEKTERNYTKPLVRILTCQSLIMDQ